MRRPTSRTVAGAVVAAVLAALLAPVAAAAPKPASPPAEDRLWTTTGDQTGLHVLVAEAATGYAWRTAATLNRPGLDADQWIGNACATVSGRHLVVVYAPRTYTNKPELFDRGGYTAVVDLATGTTRHLPVRTSLAYFNPGCGHGESAVLTQGGDTDLGKTGLITLDAATGKLSPRVEVPGQLTSAVPTADGIVGADRDAVVRVAGDGVRTVLAASTGTPFGLTTDRAGGLVFLDRAQDQVRVRRAAGVRGKPAVSTLAQGRLGELGLAASANRTVAITGTATETRALPPSVVKLDVPVRAQPSTTGAAVVQEVAPPAGDGPVRVEGRSLATGKALTATLTPEAPAPAGGLSVRERPDDAGRYCAVPRNDPKTQVYQPKPKQVEWAADMAVKGHLMVQRPANWKGNGLPAYAPQDMFKPIMLKNHPDGRVPAQILLGILGQESNLWQATRLAYPGETGNPLIGNYYGTDIYNGTPADDWDIRWDKADCGYGVSQMTDGMRLAGHEKPGETSLPWEQQKAIATDYAANLAAGLRVLQKKWNELQEENVLLNNGDPAKLENWFLATWAYNSGYHKKGEAGSAGAYGLGWLNNPANPKYDPNRKDFGKNPKDFATPQKWPYPEKVLGFASYPPSGWEAPGTEVPFFRAGQWLVNEFRDTARPHPGTFCSNTANECWYGRNEFVPDYPGEPGTGKGDVRGEPAGPCAHTNGGKFDLKCWWHTSVTWKPNCARECGFEFIRYDWPQYAAEPEDGASFPPGCGDYGLPANALVIDDVGADVPKVSKPGCASRGGAGTFDLAFGSDSARIDLHQLGGGYGAHFWFSHTNKADPLGNRLKITGTWTLNRAVNGWARVYVHVPDHAAHTRQARYDIDLGNGGSRFRVLPQRVKANKWVSLGAFPFAGTPKVRLANQTADGKGVEDIAWDAVAVVPLPRKPDHVIAALGDSYASGEGASGPDGVDYYPETDVDGKDTNGWRAACHRSTKSWSRVMTLADSGVGVGPRADAHDERVEYRSVACSGARTKNLLPTKAGVTDAWGNPAETAYGELSQLDSGWVNEDTTLVTLSVGGNDARFIDVFQFCAYKSLLRCTDPRSVMGNDPEALVTYEPKVLANQVRTSVETVLAQVVDKAPLANIVLVGYPELLSNNASCLKGLDQEEVTWLNSMGTFLNGQLKKAADNTAAKGVRIRFADPAADFAGQAVCGDPALIHSVVLDLTPGDNPALEAWPGFGVLSAQSFHPTIDGAARYARAVTRSLRDLGI
ncbi:lysophospholipase L1-like esterase [Crossiella equi]|uniref:Lysophospholipase L1-like esterase n=1 Tax=Crossiella equi TaxID=130796 RepID=A0ABS5APC3_9PSEU|nr:SGNH/GDSL hydrolase family protein [Crossiella equi]MBP2478424.1 lysophospholipase L1-like esterase [Crossiella equi]